MSYDDLLERLDESADGDDSTSPVRIAAFPDGSVDHCYTVTGLEGDRLDSRDALGRQLLEGEGDSFTLERTTVRPGGQAVNAAIQGHALGSDVTLVGHLEGSVLSDLPFETHSMGEPATIHVLAFDDEEILFSERHAEASEWGLEEFTTAVDPNRLETVDGLCCTNWVAFPGVTAVLESIYGGQETETESARQHEHERERERELEFERQHEYDHEHRRRDVPVVVDPGALGQADEEAIAGLFDTLARIDSSDSLATVVLSVNRAELDVATDVMGISSETATENERLESLREAIGISVVVLHGTDVAAAAVADDSSGGAGVEVETRAETRVDTVVDVEMLEADDVVITTGAGDRFSGALTVGLARGWNWEVTLAFANACAAHFVATGESADSSALESFVRENQ